MEFRLRKLHEVASTNEVVKRALEEGEPEGLAVRARRQTGGYGRQGRWWSSPEGGMYESLLLRPQVPPSQLPTIGLVAALAVREALLQYGDAADDCVQVKWPNDIVCPQGKLAGISSEAHAGGACIGIGVNVFRPRDEKPVGGKYVPAYFTEVARIAGAGALVDRVGDAVLDAFARRYDTWLKHGFAPFADEFNACDSLRGRSIEMVRPDDSPFIAGVAMGVDEAGCLLVRTADGVHPVMSGEVHVA